MKRNNGETAREGHRVREQGNQKKKKLIMRVMRYGRENCEKGAIHTVDSRQKYGVEVVHLRVAELIPFPTIPVALSINRPFYRYGTMATTLDAPMEEPSDKLTSSICKSFQNSLSMQRVYYFAPILCDREE